ncbi:mechanosensitive ion channel family protein [Spirulina major CS-329]|uniref:mechanosensitive ion channel family protein n=1 Tax=Spirulina TaxID=1154 RepID=UPI00232BED24|nr:mechanosensitive ion channel family protein [Spirulina major]MDB9502424.1 mechanosensitive ion channel family protein [Spirulina major CS-329]
MFWNYHALRKFRLGFDLKIITATSILSLSTLSGALPAIAQDVESEVESAITEIMPSGSEETAAEAEPLEPVTVDDPEIPINQLETLLTPLVQAQLQAEADAWFELLQEKAQEISVLELSIQQNANEEIGGDVDTQREQEVVTVTELETEQSNLISRLNIVLNALDEKGGDSTTYRQYMGAVSGLDFDITDAEGLGLRFTTWLQSEEGGIRWGINIIKIGGILIIASFVAPRSGKLVDRLLVPVENISTLFRGFIVNTTKRVVWVIAAGLSLTSVGISLGPVLALLGGLSFILAFALQSNLGNFASGMMLLLYKPFDVDDEVEIAGHWAVIKRITLANTVMQTWGQGRVISVPNSTVWGSTIVNHTPKDGVRKIAEKVCVNLNEDLIAVKEIIEQVLAEHPLVLKEDFWAGSFAWQVKEVADVYYVARCKAEDYWTVYEDLVLQIHSRLRAAGIAFSVPEYRVSMDSKVEAKAYKQLGAGETRMSEPMGIDMDVPN